MLGSMALVYSLEFKWKSYLVVIGFLILVYYCSIDFIRERLSVHDLVRENQIILNNVLEKYHNDNRESIDSGRGPIQRPQDIVRLFHGNEQFAFKLRIWRDHYTIIFISKSNPDRKYFYNENDKFYYRCYRFEYDCEIINI